MDKYSYVIMRVDAPTIKRTYIDRRRLLLSETVYVDGKQWVVVSRNFN